MLVGCRVGVGVEQRYVVERGEQVGQLNNNNVGGVDGQHQPPPTVATTSPPTVVLHAPKQVYQVSLPPSFIFLNS
jgi:hypothetical protein